MDSFFRHYIIILMLINSYGFAEVADDRLFITDVASKFIESYNQLEGVEFVCVGGGLEDYYTTESEYIDSEGQKHRLVNYKFSDGINGIHGFPHSFTVDFCKGIILNFTYEKILVV